MENPVIEDVQDEAAPGSRGFVVRFKTSKGDRVDMCAVPNDTPEEEAVAIVTEWANNWIAAFEASQELVGTSLNVTAP